MDHRKIIHRALEHLKNHQSPDGSFISLSGFVTNDFSNAIPRQTTFFTANILACLQNIPHRTRDIRRGAAEFLLTEKNREWSFNYWARNACARHGCDEEPCPAYPDDLDDTFAALVALVRYDVAIINGHAFAAIAKLLTACEAGVGGPYRTWLVDHDATASWQDVDPVVNSTIGYFLLLVGVQLPELRHFIDNAVRNGHLASPYYPGIFHIGYFLSRFYKIQNDLAISQDNEVRDTLGNILIGAFNKDNGEGITTLEHAMTISSLIDLGRTEKISSGMVDDLAIKVEREGFLPYAFCIDPTRDGKRCYAGASALTAAFCAEALARYAMYDQKQNILSISHNDKPSNDISLHDHIRALARASCHGLSSDLRATAITRIERIDDEKITSLAYEFREVLYKKGMIVPFDIVEQLSLANLYGWMAYDIYDDALDDENDVGPSPLPCANFFLRALAGIYAALDPRIPGARSLFDRTMDRIDGANAWEQGHCRIAMDVPLQTLPPHALPQFGEREILADRSIGHCMGPLAELLHAGYATDSQEYGNVELFFRHYLIARQLHDDAHDWVDDLVHGRINSVGTLVLQRFLKDNDDIDHAKMAAIMHIIPKLKNIFWEEVINEVVIMIDRHLATAHGAREDSVILTGTDFMESALRILGSAAHRAITERDEILSFLGDYRKNDGSLD